MAVCKIRNFTKASEHLHISQSAVSARIKALENSVGKVTLSEELENYIILSGPGRLF
ncbi:helix-turn-helix domain-containing protein [Paenibacillus pseudetheri]|uniref:helix-turn-helix domain-containing protein n=1 Tax=Paenibacillus pseudetheri TaxID=2897682 RepID=UPI003C6E6CC7